MAPNGFGALAILGMQSHIDLMTASSPATQLDREVIAGIVERVTYHNAENGFCVLRIKARGHRDLVTLVGYAATIAAGEWVTAGGTTAPTGSSSRLAYCAPRHRRRPKASRSISVPG